MTAAPRPKTCFTLVTMMLPGPDRKKTPAPYHFRVTFRNPNPGDIGCVATWEVMGGRDEYQVALERTGDLDMVWHCSCPDAIYHGTYHNAHCCKHVQGLVQHFETIGNPVRRIPARAA